MVPFNIFSIFRKFCPILLHIWSNRWKNCPYKLRSSYCEFFTLLSFLPPSTPLKCSRDWMPLAAAPLWVLQIAAQLRLSITPSKWRRTTSRNSGSCWCLCNFPKMLTRDRMCQSAGRGGGFHDSYPTFSDRANFQ